MFTTCHVICKQQIHLAASRTLVKLHAEQIFDMVLRWKYHISAHWKRLKHWTDVLLVRKLLQVTDTKNSRQVNWIQMKQSVNRALMQLRRFRSWTWRATKSEVKLSKWLHLWTCEGPICDIATSAFTVLMHNQMPQFYLWLRCKTLIVGRFNLNCSIRTYCSITTHRHCYHRRSTGSNKILNPLTMTFCSVPVPFNLLGINSKFFSICSHVMNDIPEHKRRFCSYATGLVEIYMHFTTDDVFCWDILRQRSQFLLFCWLIRSTDTAPNIELNKLT